VAYIETALVSSSGKLLIQLDDGTVIDAGYVKGERGPAGRDGQDGAPGIPGARGEAGANGSKWFTGVGAPDVSEGSNSDLYMDVASSMLPIYQKVSGDWLFLANLKATPVGSGGGAAGAAGGGGSVIIFPQPDGGLPPDKDNDGKPISSGDLWYDPNTGLLWVYNGTKWLPIGDRPPVSVGPNPPLWNSSGDTNNRYPVREGDLWFDSDQLALYVAALDADDDLVWIIATPANRTAVDDEVNTFVLPASATDRQEEYNPVTDTWYVYNEPKKQWIDFHPNDDPCLEIYGYILQYNGRNDTNTAFSNVNYFAFSIYSRTDYPDNRYNEHYLDAGDGLGWQKCEDMDAATLEKYGITRVDQWQVNFAGPNGSSSIWADQNVTYPDAKVKGVATQMDADGNDLLDENGDVIQVEGPEIRIYDDPAISIDERDLQPVIASCGPGQSPGKRYLLAHGDDVQDTEGDIQFYRWKDGVSFQHGDDTTPAGEETKVFLAPGFLNLQCHNGPAHLSARNSTAEVNGGDLTNIISGKDVRTTAGRHFEVFAKEDAVIKAGLSSTEDGDVRLEATGGGELVARTIDETDVDEQIVNKRYVDQKEAFLQGEIIELEEEIEGIAITSERGEWISSTTANPGEFRMVNLMGQTTQDYNDETVVSIFFNNFDAQTPSVEHGWADVEVGMILELLDRPDSDYAIYEITGVNPGATVMSFDVAFIKGVGEATLGDRTRIKIFAKPTGGSLEDYVRIAGDTMTGTLTMGNTLDMPDGADTDSPTVTFKAKNSGGTIRQSTLQVKSGANTLYASGAFRAGGAISAAGNLQYNGSDRIKLASNSSIQELRVGSDVAMQWDSQYGIRGIRAANSWGENGKFLSYSSSYGLQWTTPPSTSYSLPTANTSTKGGVTVWTASSSYTFVGCTKMSGSQIGVVLSTNTQRGVNYKGICAITSGTPSASSYQQGTMVFSTSTNAVYIRT
jgi:hypothetical protein